MCEATPVGELCETRIAMNNEVTITNGHGESEQVTTIFFQKLAKN